MIVKVIHCTSRSKIHTKFSTIRMLMLRSEYLYYVLRCVYTAVVVYYLYKKIITIVKVYPVTFYHIKTLGVPWGHSPSSSAYSKSFLYDNNQIPR